MRSARRLLDALIPVLGALLLVDLLLLHRHEPLLETLADAMVVVRGRRRGAGRGAHRDANAG